MSAAYCPSCGTPASGGNFCASCGGVLGRRTCHACGAELDPRARFCHRCAVPVGGVIARKSEHLAWGVAGAALVLLLAAVAWFLGRGVPGAATPEMANVGSASGGLATQASDISQMSPRERFDRLFERVTRALAAGDTLEVSQFTPMALGAYAMLDVVDADARFHAAVLRLNIGDFDGALALADTIESGSPGHLFGPLLRGTVAEAQDDQALLLQSYRAFLAAYDREIAAGRPEYADHAEVVSEFRAQAEAAERR